MLIQRDQVFNDEIKNIIFNCVDVGMCCSESGNIDLNSLDMMCVGVPQVICAGGGYNEYINETNGAPVKLSCESYSANNGEISTLAEIKSVNYEDVFLALERYLKNSDLLEEHRVAAGKIHADWAENCSDLLTCIFN